MMVFEYYNDEKKGMLRPGMTMAETSKVLKSDYIFYKKLNEYEYDRYSFNNMSLITYYDDDTKKLIGINLVSKTSVCMFKNNNLFTNYKQLNEIFSKLKIEPVIIDVGLEIEGAKLGIFIPEIHDDPNKPDYEEPIVKAIYVDFTMGNCSLSFERLTSNHIPSKEAYKGSKITALDGSCHSHELCSSKIFCKSWI